MGFSFKLGFNIVISLILLSTFCYADMAALSDDEMGDFIAEEGVCDIRLPDTCNTDPVLMETLSKDKEDIKQAITDVTKSPLYSMQTDRTDPNPAPSITADDILNHMQQLRFEEMLNRIKNQ